jgi:hypothetical protein
MQNLGILRVEPYKELIEMVPCGPEGWDKTRAARIAGISKVELTLRDLQAISSLQVVSENGNIMG